MKQKVEPAELGDDQHDLLVDHMVQNKEKMIRKPVVKKVQMQLKKALNSLEFVDTDLKD